MRLALGAAPRDILWVVTSVTGRWAIAGIVLGLIVAIGSTHALGSLLFDVEALDGVTYTAVIGIVVGLVTLASYLPARHAAGIDPISLLRRD